MVRPSWRSAYLSGLLLIGAIGCNQSTGNSTPKEIPHVEPPALGAQFEPAATGSIRGRVAWNGPLPVSNSYREAKIVFGSLADATDRNNPLFPRIAPDQQGIGDVVVFLRSVDPERSKAWDLSTASLEMRDSGLSIQQAQGRHRAGFIPVGSTMEMVSSGPKFEMLRARGAAFFTQAFPDLTKPLRRSFTQPGVVEFSSAAGNYQSRVWLFVVAHPYWVHTDDDGAFTLEQVPEGRYELVAWMPNWRVERFERDPENGFVARLWYEKPVEKIAEIEVKRGQTANIDFSYAIGDFSGKFGPK